MESWLNILRMNGLQNVSNVSGNEEMPHRNMSREGRRIRHARAANLRNPPPEPPLNPTRNYKVNLLGGVKASTVFSHLGAEHSKGMKGHGILQFLNRKNQCLLSRTCRDARGEVGKFELADNSPILGDLEIWHTTHPRATVANVSGRALRLRDFELLHGIKKLNMSGCNLHGAFDIVRAFDHLRGIEELNVSDCPMRAFNFNVFPSLAGIKKLEMARCKAVLGADDFYHLRGIEILNIDGCTQLTDAALAPLAGIKDLYMKGCTQFTDAVLAPFAGLERLGIDDCVQLTGATFPASIKIIDMNDCINVTDAALASLHGLEELYIGGCTQLTDAAFVNLDSLQKLNMQECTGVTDVAFDHLTRVKYLDMSDCNQPGITAAAIAKLDFVTVLITEGCTDAVNDAADLLFEHNAQLGGRRKFKKSKSKSKSKSKKSKSKTRRIR
jgi:hypothetical protein